jgi:hypothetical protein
MGYAVLSSVPTWGYTGTIGTKIKYNFLCALDIKASAVKHTY